MFSFYQEFSNLELFLFWIIVCVFIFFITFSFVLKKKNKELLKLISDMENTHSKTVLELEKLQKKISINNKDNEITNIRDNNGLYKKNILKDLGHQTSPIDIQSNISYLENAKKSLEEASELDISSLTEYEEQQELDAIISYQELKKNKDRLYNITNDEDDGDFIQELKSFRSDL